MWQLCALSYSDTHTCSTRHMYSFLPMGCLQKYCSLAWLRLYPRNSQPPRKLPGPGYWCQHPAYRVPLGPHKTKLVRCMHGTSETLLPSHLTEYWWEQMHRATPFNDIL